MPRLRKPHPILDRAIALIVIVVVLCCLAMSAIADNAPGWFTMGAQPMCRNLPAECAPYAKGDAWQIELTDANLATLNRVNDQVNAEIQYRSDWDHWGLMELWNYPLDGLGDCEDFALEKRRRLVALGFPRRALLLTILDMHETVGLHMVLIARTDRGDILLDLDGEYTPVRSTLLTPHYDYLWVQSQKDPTVFTAWNEDKTPNDTRCFGAGRYDAMRDGATC
jgi:predicted transglutaminase-like cysteine proteinase